MPGLAALIWMQLRGLTRRHRFCCRYCCCGCHRRRRRLHWRARPVGITGCGDERCRQEGDKTGTTGGIEWDGWVKPRAHCRTRRTVCARMHAGYITSLACFWCRRCGAMPCHAMRCHASAGYVVVSGLLLSQGSESEAEQAGRPSIHPFHSGPATQPPRWGGRGGRHWVGLIGPLHWAEMLHRGPRSWRWIPYGRCRVVKNL